MKLRLAALVPAMAAFAAVIAAAAPAATPSSGTIGPPDGTSVTWTGPERTAATTGPSDGECNDPGTPGDPTDPGGFCDDFTLTVNVPQRQGSFTVDVTGSVPAMDYDLYVYDGRGGEPQTTLERRESWTPNGAPVDPNRIFVDWPLSTRSNIGQLNRSLDGGDSFRLLFDPTCAARSRPNCATGGGGDTEEDVNLVNRHVLFSDQEALANEAYAASTDHGDP